MSDQPIIPLGFDIDTAALGRAKQEAAGLAQAVGGVADRPVARDWPLLSGAALDEALNHLAWSLEARDEPQASAALRRRLVRHLGRRAIDQALASRSPL